MYSTRPQWTLSAILDKYALYCIMVDGLQHTRDEMFDYIIKKLISTMEIDDMAVTYAGDCCHLESELFTLELQHCGLWLRVINIAVTTEGEGYGRTIMTAIAAVCRRERVSLVAANVTPGKEGFWEALGYTEDPTNPDDYLHPAAVPLSAVG